MSLSQSDLTVIEREPRVTSMQLQAVLGYNTHQAVHRIIERNLDELEDFGGLFSFEAKKSGRGRPTKTYLLNEHQATAIAMWANTPEARKARMQIIEVFVAWRRGDLGVRGAAPVADPLNSGMTAGAERARCSAEYLRELYGLNELNNIDRDVTHLPIWPSNRRPNWWHDTEVRTYLTDAHRQMSSVRCAAEGKQMFGDDRCPGKSAICEYWLRLDRAKKADNPHRRPRLRLVGGTDAGLPK